MDDESLVLNSLLRQYDEMLKKIGVLDLQLNACKKSLLATFTSYTNTPSVENLVALAENLKIYNESIKEYLAAKEVFCAVRNEYMTKVTGDTFETLNSNLNSWYFLL